MPSPRTHSLRLLLAIAAAVLVVAVFCGLPAGSAGASGSTGWSAARPKAVVASDWTTFDQNPLRTAVDASGNSLSSASQAWTSPIFDGQLYGQPLEATGRVFAATENDTVYALAADSGLLLWSKHLATPVESSALPCGDIGPTVGITSTPVIDTARSEIFVVADEAAAPIAIHHLIGLDLYTGAVVLDEVIDPPGTDPAAALQRTSLALDRGNVIVGFGGNAGDCSDYHGLVVSAPEDGSPPTTFVVANLPGDSQGAVWMGGAAPPIDAQGNVWVSTGNGAYTSSGDPYDDSDGVLKLSPSMQLLDYFAPSQWYSDNGTDFDLGSAAPALLPNGLVFQVGKSFTAYTLRQSSLGHVGGQLHSTSDFCGNDPDGGSADLNGTLFVPCSDGLRAVTPTAGSAPTAQWETSSGAHSSPIVAGGLVWSIGGDTLYALDPASGNAVQQFVIGSAASSFPSPSAADGLVLAPATDHIDAFKGPGGLPAAPSPPPPTPPPPPQTGYWLVASDGGVFSFGNAGFHGSTGAIALNQPMVGMASTSDHGGYWLVASDGGVFNFGDAGFHGSTGAVSLNKPIVGMSSTPDGGGYWLVASDGGVFSFGDAAFHGSTGAIALNKPIVGMAATPDGNGYWLVASDGGVFSFGDAAFHGSTGAIALNEPIVGMAPPPTGRLLAGGLRRWGVHLRRRRLPRLDRGHRPQPADRGDGGDAGRDGYWLVASDGGVFTFGDAGFHGSTGAIALNRPIVGTAVG